MLLIGLFIFPVHINTSYNSSYYEKYNPAIGQLLNTPYAKHINFHIQSGKLKADSIVYKLSSASDIKLNQKTLEEYDLKTVIIRIGNKLYKSKPSFKKLVFVKKGRKGMFRYSIVKDLTLVYVPYADKMQVIGVISQGQFIRENKYKEYDLNVNKEVKEQILRESLSLLGCRHFKKCDIKSDNEGNYHFYKGYKLIGVMENFGNEKILIQEKDNQKKHIATVRKYGNRILMEDSMGNILYENDGSKRLKILIKSLNYKIELSISEKP